MSDIDLSILTEEEVRMLRETFYQQSLELIEALTECALSLEGGADRSATMRNIKRFFHTLKGDSATVGLRGVSKIVHHMEDLMGLLEDTDGEFDGEAVDLTLKTVDELAVAISNHQHGGEDKVSGFLMDRIEGFIEWIKTRKRAEKEGVLLAQSEEKKAEVYRKEGREIYTIKLVFSPECMMKGAGGMLVGEYLREAGEIIKVSPPLDSSDIEAAKQIEVVMASDKGIEDIKTACSIPGVICEAHVERYSSEMNKPLASMDVFEAEAPHKEGIQTIRVVSEKIDQMMDLVGELVMGRSMIVRLTEELEKKYPREDLVGNFLFVNSFIERSLADLQRSVMGVRMVPVGRVFKRFPRMVRDLGRSSNKTIRLEIRGEDAEIDKALVDMLGEPLLHLLRNAVDHGVEESGEREAVGKVPYGTIRIDAYHQGSDIVIEVSDDGRGIDARKLIEKARDKGIITGDEAERMDEKEALGLIYHSGFSTARVVTDVSGRGIGMDIVKSVVEGMRGTIRLKTELGAGTTFTLRFPLTLAIIRGIIFDIGGRLFALPLGSVGEILRVFRKDIEMVAQREVVRYRGRVLPLVSLHNMTNSETKHMDKMFVMVVSGGDNELGLVVDNLIGEQELVVKAVDKHWMNSEMVSGASILGDGKIVLILNLFGIITRGIKGKRGFNKVA